MCVHACVCVYELNDLSFSLRSLSSLVLSGRGEEKDKDKYIFSKGLSL